MIVDAHLHLWHSDPAYPNQGGTTVSPACDIPLKLLDGYMDEYRVDRAVIVQPLYPGEDNHFVVECAQTAPERFAVVCVVDPTSEDAVRHLKFWGEEKDCRGLRLRPVGAAEEASFGDPSSFPLWKYAAQAGNENKLIVCIVCDFGERYVQTVLFDQLRYEGSDSLES